MGAWTHESVTTSVLRSKAALAQQSLCEKIDKSGKGTKDLAAFADLRAEQSSDELMRWSDANDAIKWIAARG